MHETGARPGPRLLRWLLQTRQLRLGGIKLRLQARDLRPDFCHLALTLGGGGLGGSQFLAQPGGRTLGCSYLSLQFTRSRHALLQLGSRLSHGGVDGVQLLLQPVLRGLRGRLGLLHFRPRPREIRRRRIDALLSRDRLGPGRCQLGLDLRRFRSRGIELAVGTRQVGAGGSALIPEKGGCRQSHDGDQAKHDG